jgi:hypothetical protein
MAFIRSSKHGILALCVVTILSISGLLAMVQPVKAAPAAAQEQSIEQQELPGSTGQLPLISILGIGMLSGGLISVLRTRPAKQAAK